MKPNKKFRRRKTKDPGKCETPELCERRKISGHLSGSDGNAGEIMPGVKTVATVHSATIHHFIHGTNAVPIKTDAEKGVANRINRLPFADDHFLRREILCAACVQK